MNLADILEYCEIKEKVKARDLTRGICSESYLSRVRNRERVLNPLFFIYIIRRLYLSPERFEIKISKKEYMLVEWLQKCQDMIRHRDYPALYKSLYKGVSEDQLKMWEKYAKTDIFFYKYIVIMEINKDPKKALQILQNSLNYMISYDASIIVGRYSCEELNHFMNYLELSYRQKTMDKLLVKQCFETILSMARNNRRDPREEAKLHPRIICFTLRTIGDCYPYSLWKIMLEDALDYLRKNTSCYDLPEILRLLKEACENLKDQNSERVQHWYEAICLAFDIGKCDCKFNKYDTHDNDCQYYYTHEYLKRNRLTNNDEKNRITQAEISADIIDPSNYSRIESGKNQPARETYKQLTKRINASSDLYEGEIISNHIEDYWLITEVRNASNTGDIKKLRCALSELEVHLDRSFPENSQFLDSNLLNIELLEGSLSEKESINRLIKILAYTIPYDINKDHYYSHLELEIIYRIVRNKRIYGLLAEKDKMILESCLISEEKASFSSWERRRLIKRLLAGILQVEGNTEKSEQYARECIEEMLYVQKANILVDCLDILAESILEKDSVMAEKMIQAAYWISDLYQNEQNKRSMEELYFDVFQRSLLDHSPSSVGGVMRSST